MVVVWLSSHSHAIGVVVAQGALMREMVRIVPLLKQKLAEMMHFLVAVRLGAWEKWQFRMGAFKMAVRTPLWTAANAASIAGHRAHNMAQVDIKGIGVHLKYAQQHFPSMGALQLAPPGKEGQIGGHLIVQ